MCEYLQVKGQQREILDLCFCESNPPNPMIHYFKLDLIHRYIRLFQDNWCNGLVNQCTWSLIQIRLDSALWPTQLNLHSNIQALCIAYSEE